jgi:hypothetical protein
MQAQRRAFITAAALAFLMLAIPSSANAGNQLGTLRGLTARFHEVERAESAGYGLFPDAAGIACIQSGAGVMGLHYVNGDLVGGSGIASIDVARPEALVYQPLPNGELRLVAVEYIVFVGAWPGSGRPSLFGRQFDFTPSPNRYGIPAFYSLHAWIWQHNPSGAFEPYNPSGTCRS